MDSAAPAVPHTALSHPTSLFMLQKKENKNLISLYKFLVMECWICTPLHGLAVRQEVLGMGLPRVKWICFPHSLPVGCGKNITHYTAFFPKRASCGVKCSRKGWKSAWPPRCCCCEWSRPPPRYQPRGWALVVGQPIPQRKKNGFVWLLHPSILNRMSNYFICLLQK